jgi:hypothetical protein
MNAGRAAEIRNLRGLKNISWLSARQLNRLATALSISAVEKREIIPDDKHSPESGLCPCCPESRITCRKPQGRSHAGNYGCAGNDSGFSATGAGIGTRHPPVDTGVKVHQRIAVKIHQHEEEGREV